MKIIRNEHELKEMSKRMRLKALQLAYDAGDAGAHLGGGLSSIEILATLYGAVANVDNENPYNEDRDRILMGKAHCVLAYYTALHEVGFISDKELNSFEKDGTMFVGHPVRNIEKGIEYSGGSLGMALSVGAGMAIHAKKQKSLRKIYVLLGDGECEEGSIWEAMMFASKYQLDNLVAIVDRNKLQSDGLTCDVIGLDNLPEKFSAFGWEVVQVDGHNVSELLRAYQTISVNKPLVIIADTVKGKGVSFMEGNVDWHHAELKEEMYKRAREEVEERGLDNAGNNIKE